MHFSLFQRLYSGNRKKYKMGASENAFSAVYSEGIVSETPDTPAILPKADTPSGYSIIQNADSIMIGVYKTAVTVHIGEGLNQKSWTMNKHRKRYVEMPNQRPPSLRLIVQFTEKC